MSFVLPSQVCDIIKATLKPFHSSLDNLPTWNLTFNGQFSNRSAYILATNLPMKTNSQNWKWVWKTPTIPRVMTFLWLACHNRLPTKNHLASKHILNDDSCSLCHLSPETTIHILRDCPIILPIWNDLSNSILSPDFLTLELPGWLKLMSTSPTKTPSLPFIPWKTYFPLVVWTI